MDDMVVSIKLIANMKEAKKFYRVKLIWNRIRHGMFIYSLINLLTRFGLDLGPYIWVQEGVSEIEPPVIRGSSDGFSLQYLNLDEVKEISKLSSGANVEKNVNYILNGQKCIGLKKGEEIAAYMFIEFNDFVFCGRNFPLKNNEVYLLNMYTFEAFRGKNIAPYLRNESYKLLGEQGIDTFYSITDYFNKASIKFKKKLKAKNLKLYFYIRLIKKFEWNFLLWRY